MPTSPTGYCVTSRLSSRCAAPDVACRTCRDGKARLTTTDYAGCAADMEQAVESVPNSPKAWGYEAYCYFLDKDPKAGLSAWYTARSFDPAITLDSQKEQNILLVKVRQASAPPPAAK